MSETGKNDKSSAREERQARLAAELRANLKRRKAKGRSPVAEDEAAATEPKTPAAR